MPTKTSFNSFFDNKLERQDRQESQARDIPGVFLGNPGITGRFFQGKIYVRPGEASRTLARDPLIREHDGSFNTLETEIRQ